MALLVSEKYFIYTSFMALKTLIDFPKNTFDLKFKSTHQSVLQYSKDFVRTRPFNVQLQIQQIWKRKFIGRHVWTRSAAAGVPGEGVESLLVNYMGTHTDIIRFRG